MMKALSKSSSLYLCRKNNMIGGDIMMRQQHRNSSSNSWVSDVAIRTVSSVTRNLPLSSSSKQTTPTTTISISDSYRSKRRLLSEATTTTAAATEEQYNSSTEDERPTGILFQSSKPSMGSSELIGARGMIRRTFGPRSNAEGLLATGGPDLAAHASFDPDYHRAQDWIRHHAVGPAVLSPILISGLTGALTEAAFPHGVITYQSMKHLRPLIVGVPVASIIEVVSVTKAERIKPTMESQPSDDNDVDENDHPPQRTHGYDVTLRTIVSRVRDDCIIAEGVHELWVPDYLHM